MGANGLRHRQRPRLVHAVALAALLAVGWALLLGARILLLLHPTFALRESSLSCLPPDPFYPAFFNKAPEQGSRRIPRIIHNLWKDELIPAKWNTTVFSCRHIVHPEWEFMLWTDRSARDFVAEHYAWFLDHYDNYRHPIQRVDAARYFLIYHFGGVYLDLDVGCRMPLDLITSQGWGGVLPVTSPSGLSNDVLMFAPRHPFMKEVIDGLAAADRSWGVGYLTVMATAGPVYLSNKYARWLDAHGGDQEDIIMLPAHLYANTLKSFFFHLPGDTWHEADAVVFLFIAEHIKAIACLAAVAGIVALGLYHRRRRSRLARRRMERKREDLL